MLTDGEIIYEVRAGNNRAAVGEENESLLPKKSQLSITLEYHDRITSYIKLLKNHLFSNIVSSGLKGTII